MVLGRRKDEKNRLKTVIGIVRRKEPPTANGDCGKSTWESRDYEGLGLKREYETGSGGGGGETVFRTLHISILFSLGHVATSPQLSNPAKRVTTRVTKEVRFLRRK